MKIRLVSSLQQDRNMRYCRVVRAHAFGRFGFDPYTVPRNSAQPGDVFADRFRMRSDFWSGKYQSGIQIHQSVARAFDALQGLAQKYGGIGIFPLWIRGWKQRSNIGTRDGAQQRVGNRMQQDVAIGMASETFIVR